MGDRGWGMGDRWVKWRLGSVRANEEGGGR